MICLSGMGNEGLGFGFGFGFDECKVFVKMLEREIEEE